MTAAKAWFIVGTIPLIVAGAGHAVLAVIDSLRPTYFTPNDEALRPQLDATGIRLRQMAGRGAGEFPSLWRVWLGIHVSHGLGILTFGLMCLLIAITDFGIVQRVWGLQAISVAFPAALVGLSLRFWFYGPLAITSVATACFTLSAALAW